MKIEYAPIALFVYKRPWHTRKVLESIRNNPISKKSVLYIFADGPKKDTDSKTLEKIKKTRKILRSKVWAGQVHVVESDENIGLANSIIGGINQVLYKYDKIIVLEDDLYLGDGFLDYMNNALTKYQDNNKIMHISGYNYPAVDHNIVPANSAFFIPWSITLAWATWKRAWEKFDPFSEGYRDLKTNTELEYRFNLEGTYRFSDMLIRQHESKSMDSWAIRWNWSVFKNNGLSLAPDKSLVQYFSSGIDSTHVKGNDGLLFSHKDFNRAYYIDKFPSQALVNEDFYARVKQCIKLIVNYQPPQKTINTIGRIRIFITRMLNLFKK